MRGFFAIVSVALASLSVVSAAPSTPANALERRVVGPGRVTGNTAVHDPSMCKDGSGKYFLFATGQGLPIRTSTDRIAWTLVGSVFPNGAPAATKEYTAGGNGDLWAPDCTFVNGQFRLFYAASGFGKQKSGIFYATSPTGLPGSWTDRGLVIASSSSNNFNAIDPNLLISGNGQWYLTLGSFWTGIKQVRIDSNGKLKDSSVTAIASRTGTTAIEAPVIFANGGYFYAFTSWDKCCSGTSSTYNIRVGRSTSVNGGFVDQSGKALTAGGGTLVLGTHDSIIGPGGQDVFDDSDGPILVYHYYTSSGSYLGINKLDFSSGWPVVV